VKKVYASDQARSVFESGRNAESGHLKVARDMVFDLNTHANEIAALVGAGGNSKNWGVVFTEAGSYFRLTDSCTSPLKAQRPSRTCNESKEEEEGTAWSDTPYRGTLLTSNRPPLGPYSRTMPRALSLKVRP